MPELSSNVLIASTVATAIAQAGGRRSLVRKDSLETVELMMALEAQNLMGSGFETSVRNACDATGAEFLFNIPAPSSLPFQRAALVRLAAARNELVLISLSADGMSMDAQVENPQTAHLFRLGEAWLAVVDQFRKLS